MTTPHETSTVPGPLWTSAGITAAATAVLALLTAFGLNLTTEQTAAILGVVGVVAPLIVAWASNSRVTANTEVLEARVGGIVVAGLANERVPAGDPVRFLDVSPDDEIPAD